MSSAQPKAIFPPWHFQTWTAVDDRVRGGASHSYLEPVEVAAPFTDTEKSRTVTAARFWGNLDINTLGGAGFASQKHIFGPFPFELPPFLYSGISFHLLPDTSLTNVASESKKTNKSTVKEYTLVLKTTLSDTPTDPPEPRPDPVSLSYEATFPAPTDSSSFSSRDTKVNLAWTDFKPFYRGREVPRNDKRWAPLKSERIYEIGLMCRSGFGKQEGEFGVVILGMEGIARESLRKVGYGYGMAGEGWASWIWSWVSSVWRSLSLGGEERIKLDEVEK